MSSWRQTRNPRNGTETSRDQRPTNRQSGSEGNEISCCHYQRVYEVRMLYLYILIIKGIHNNQKNKKRKKNKRKIKNKKHSENADTSTSVTFDLDMWPWPYFKVKKAYIIRCRLLYCALVPGMMSVNIIVCEIWPLIHCCDLWPSLVAFSLCQGYFHSNQLM